jgi:hypothetical protein
MSVPKYYVRIRTSDNKIVIFHGNAHEALDLSGGFDTREEAIAEKLRIIKSNAVIKLKTEKRNIYQKKQAHVRENQKRN